MATRLPMSIRRAVLLALLFAAFALAALVLAPGRRPADSVARPGAAEPAPATAEPAPAATARAATESAASGAPAAGEPDTGEPAERNRRPLEPEPGEGRGTIAGTVVTAAGEPASAALLLEPVGAGQTFVAGVATARDGFVARGVAAGRYRLVTRAIGVDDPIYSAPFTVVAGTEITLPPFVLDPALHPRGGLTLAGTVLVRRGPNRAPEPLRRLVGGVDLVALGPGGLQRETRSDTRGAFTFRGLEPGRYTVVVRSRGMRAEPPNEFDAGADGAVLVAGSGTRTLRGTVVAAGARPRRFTVRLVERHGEHAWQRAWIQGQRGSFSAPALPLGDYEATVFTSGAEPSTHVVTVVPGTRAQRVELAVR